jgi:predicted nucleic acid-binding protein
MNFLLDTNHCSAYLAQVPKVWNRVLQYGGGIAVSTVVVGELWVVAERRGHRSSYVQDLRRMLTEFHILPFDLDCAQRFGEVRADLLARGLDVGVADAMIAATALVHNLTVVTHNVRHFENIPGLRWQDWLA